MVKIDSGLVIGLAIIGGIGYLLWKYGGTLLDFFKGGKAIQEAGQILVQPVINIPTPQQQQGVQAPTPINYIFPPSGIPWFFNQAQIPTGIVGGAGNIPATQPEKGYAEQILKSTMSPLEYIFPPLGIKKAIETVPGMVELTAKTAFGTKTAKPTVTINPAVVTALSKTQIGTGFLSQVTVKTPTVPTNKTGSLTPSNIVTALTGLVKAPVALVSPTKQTPPPVTYKTYTITPTNTTVSTGAKPSVTTQAKTVVSTSLAPKIGVTKATAIGTKISRMA